MKKGHADILNIFAQDLGQFELIHENDFNTVIASDVLFR